VAVGLVLLAAPGPAVRLWLGARDAPAMRAAARGLGGRDLALGLGALLTLGGGGSAGAWVRAGALADAVDFVSVLGARRAVGGARRSLLLASAGTAAVVGARAARVL
jgi:hypothetical protein